MTIEETANEARAPRAAQAHPASAEGAPHTAWGEGRGDGAPHSLGRRDAGTAPRTAWVRGGSGDETQTRLELPPNLGGPRWVSPSARASLSSVSPGSPGQTPDTQRPPGQAPSSRSSHASQGDGHGTQQLPRQERPHLGPEGFPEGEVQAPQPHPQGTEGM